MVLWTLFRYEKSGLDDQSEFGVGFSGRPPGSVEMLILEKSTGDGEVMDS